jgi:hypothetical protein
MRNPSARAHARFQLEVPVSIRWSEAGAEREVLGRTRDIAESGVFVLCPVTPAVGDEVWLEVQLPDLNEPGGSGLRISSPGKVVRLAGPGEKSGFAAQAKFALPG